MDKNFYYQIERKPTQNRSILLRFAATDLNLYKIES